MRSLSALLGMSILLAAVAVPVASAECVADRCVAEPDPCATCKPKFWKILACILGGVGVGSVLYNGGANDGGSAMVGFLVAAYCIDNA